MRLPKFLLLTTAVACVTADGGQGTPSAAGAPPPAGTPQLACRLESDAVATVGSPAPLRFTLVNHAARPIYVLRWNTPLEGVLNRIFEVVLQGAPVPYLGPMLKRGQPQKADYVALPPNGSSAATINLAETYDLSRPGEYGATLRARVLDYTWDESSLPRQASGFEAVELTCGPVMLSVRSAP